MHWTEQLYETGKYIREAADLLEAALKERGDDGSVKYAELWLASRYLVKAHSLVCTGEMSGEDMRWAMDRANEIDGARGDTGQGK